MSDPRARINLMGRIDHVYKAAERPSAEVWWDGAWRWATIRMWSRLEDDSIVASVNYSRGPAENYLGTFPLDQVRPADEQTGEPLDPSTVWPWTLTRKPTDS